MATDYIKRARVARKVMNRLKKFEKRSRSLNRVDVEIIRFSGIDVKYRLEDGTIKTVKLYGKTGNRVENVSNDELKGVHAELSYQYQKQIQPRAYIQAKEFNFKTIRPRGDVEKEYSAKTKEAFGIINEQGINITIEMLDEVEDFIARFDPWGAQSDTELRNLYYVEYGAREVNSLYVTGFYYWCKARGINPMDFI